VTEAEWLVSTDPAGTLELVGDASDRKLRLFSVACCRSVSRFMSNDSFDTFLVQVDRFVESNIGPQQLARARGEMTPARRESGRASVLLSARSLERVTGIDVDYDPRSAAEAAAAAWGRVWDAALLLAGPSPRECALASGRATDAVRRDARLSRSFDPPEAPSQFARDIFGNPLRPAAFDPRWRTADAVGLARAIYEDRAFDRLPLLADALMDAGCDSEDILAHCRGDGPHVRGCWVVDLVLGKE